MTQALEVKKQTPLQEVRHTLESEEMKKQIKMALPPHVPVEKFIRVVTTALANDPKLVAANRMSLYNACLKSAADGLIPDGKEAALVPFGEVVTYMPMVAGILKKVRNSGELASISAHIVHEKEKFRHWVDDTGEHVEFEPMSFGEKGEAIGVFARAKTKEGDVYIEVMDKAQVMAVKSVARTKAIWDGPFSHEKWKVACIRRLSKRLPMSTDLEQTIQRADEDINFEQEPEKPEEPKTKSSRLSSIIESQTQAPAQTQMKKPAPAEPNEAPLTEAEEAELPI